MHYPDSRSERSGEVRVPAPREMLKVKEKVSKSDDVEREEAEDDDADAEDTAEMIGDDLVAAWGMKEEPSESETEETSEKPLDDDGDEYDYRDEEEEEDESHDDLEDANLSLERIDEFEEYEDDNLKVEGQVSNRRVDLGMDRVRKPWPTKSRQGSPAADHPHRLHQQQQPQQQPEAQRRTQLHFKKRIIATGPVPRLPAGGGNYPAAGGSKGQYQGHPPRSRKPMPPWARGGPQYKKKWSKKVPPPKGGYGKFGGKPGRRRPHHPQGRPLPTPVPAVPGGVPTARLRITKITTTVTSPTAHEIEEEEMMRLAEMALKVESKRDQIKKFRDQIQSIARDGGGDDEEEQEDDDEEPEGDIVYEVESREDIDNADAKRADTFITENSVGQYRGRI